MIVIGLDVHKQSVTAVAVDEAGRQLEEKLIPVGSDELPAWAAGLDGERLWAVEDCRQLSRWLERQLLSVGEDVVRVPPKLTVPERRAGRTRGKSDPIDALAIARAAIREPGPRSCSPRSAPFDRFRTDAQLARHSGAAPLEASSGKSQRHRLDRGGNRQLNAALYRIAITQARYHAPAREYLDRKRAEGKSRREALRCLKRLLVRVVFNTLKASPALT